ncbi:FAD/NAD(P)-binding domain-containing protein [Mycena venus]|uniref:FAD/NAD(P)-binding domain-containing protein n=1 Tax=Mycena venus TaxID=2733690 RepID=A0A8H6XAC8_9AGAR|nr:FAD/NAD(P)-binding domain-containing protein [Mycena venus]
MPNVQHARSGPVQSSNTASPFWIGGQGPDDLWIATPCHIKDHAIVASISDLPPRLFFCRDTTAMINEDSPQPLKVTIVGAGIGGLATAIALRRNGHLVQVLETSEIKTEIGAGIGVQVNALRVLEHWGLVRENLKGVSYDGITTFDSKTGDGVARRWLLPDMDQNRSLLCHRKDVHDELMRLAVGVEGEGPPARLHLGRRVVDCSPEDGTITLKDGEIIHADLVIGADGLHSIIRTSILGHVQTAPASGYSCFRSLVDASKLREIDDIDAEWFTEGLSGMRGLQIKEGEGYRMVVMYLCRSGTLINLVSIYADPHQDNPDWSPVGTREELLRIFHDLHPKFLALLSLSDTPILRWQLRVLPLLDNWIRGHAALLGDAAHATLPTLGQGAALAIEEAGALGCLLPRGTRREDVPGRLEAYQTLRKPRGDYVNREALEQATEPVKRGLYFRSHEVQDYLLRHNAIKDAQEYYEKYFGSGA